MFQRSKRISIKIKKKKQDQEKRQDQEKHQDQEHEGYITINKLSINKGKSIPRVEIRSEITEKLQ